MSSQLFMAGSIGKVTVSSALSISPLPGQQFDTLYVDLTDSAGRLEPFGSALIERVVLQLPETVTADDFHFNAATGRVEWQTAGDVRATLPLDAQGLSPRLQIGDEGFRLAVNPDDLSQLTLEAEELPAPSQASGSAPSLLYVDEDAQKLVLHSDTELRPLPGQTYTELEIELASPAAHASLPNALRESATMVLPETDAEYGATFDEATGNVVVTGGQGPVLSLPVGSDGATSPVRVGSGEAVPIELEASEGGEVAIVSAPWLSAPLPDDDISPLESAEALSESLAGVDSASLLAGNDPILAALDSQNYWLGDTLTYGFNDAPHESYTGNDLDGWQSPPTAVRTAVHEIMAAASQQLGIELAHTDTPGAAHIRFNMVDTEGKDFQGYAYYPPETTNGQAYTSIANGNKSGPWGDVFLSRDFGETLAGDEDYFTIVHELGHALGLAHTFDGDATLPETDDHQAHSAMSYDRFQPHVLDPYIESTGASSYQWGYTTDDVIIDQFMVYDLAALHSRYGTDTTTATGNDTYAFDDAEEFTTLWDAGGEDTLDLSAVTNPNQVDLTPGAYSFLNFRGLDAVVDEAVASIAEQAAELDINADMDTIGDWFDERLTEGTFDSLYTGEKALGIAHGTLIENVVGGDGGNTITDNAVDNVLTGGGSDDTFVMGAGGFDSVNGLGGFDTIDLSHLQDLERSAVEIAAFTELVPAGEEPSHDWLLLSDDFAVAFSNINQVQFANPADDWLLA